MESVIWGWWTAAEKAAEPWLALPPVAVGMAGWRFASTTSMSGDAFAALGRHDAVGLLVAVLWLLPWGVLLHRAVAMSVDWQAAGRMARSPLTRQGRTGRAAQGGGAGSYRPGGSAHFPSQGMSTRGWRHISGQAPIRSAPSFSTVGSMKGPCPPTGRLPGAAAVSVIS